MRKKWKQKEKRQKPNRRGWRRKEKGEALGTVEMASELHRGEQTAVGGK